MPNLPLRWAFSTTVGSSAVLLLAVALCPSARAEERLTEAQYVQRVLTASLEAKVLDAEAALGRAGAVGAGAWPNPSVAWERQPNPTEDQVVGGQHVVTASIPLVLSGRLGLEADSAARGAQAAEVRWARARAELRRDATLAFASVLAAAERRAVSERSLATLDQLTRVIEAREKAGEAAGYERARIVLERALSQDELRAAELDERRAQSTAIGLLGPGVTALPSLVGELTARRAPEQVTGLEEALEARADLRALALEVEQAELAQRAAARQWIPELSVTAGALLLEGAQPGAGTGYVVGLGLPLPLFQRGQGERARAAAQRSLAAARYERHRHAARLELKVALDLLKGRRERLERHRSEVLARAEELRAIAAAGYRGGSVDLLALVDAERVARGAAQTAIQLALDVAAAESELLLLAGADDAVEARRVP